MAKEVAGLIKLQIKGGAANPSPPILGRRGQDDGIMQQHGIAPIDMVVVNPSDPNPLPSGERVPHGTGG